MAIEMPKVNRLVPGLIEPTGSVGTKKVTPGSAEGGNFTEMLSNLINSVNDTQNEAAQSQNALLAGEPVELHDVMIKAEEAGLAMDLLLEVRNRLLSAYNEIMKMPM
jgi:flagellar hook-basal body complex protein FliE